jgi:hypothetical protein
MLNSAMQTVRALISSGDYGYAIDLVDYSVKILKNELNNIIAVNAYASSFNDLRILIQKVVIDDFASIAVSNMEQIDLVI